MARNCGQTQRKGSKNEVHKENNEKSHYDRKLRAYITWIIHGASLPDCHAPLGTGWQSHAFGESS
jgi:hypothetical protein